MVKIDILVGANTSERVGYYLKLFEDQTYKDFRVICICKDEIKDEFDFEFKYVQEKGRAVWPMIKTMRHALYKNELLFHAESQYILLWDAWQIPGDELLAEHIKYLDQGYGVAGGRIECKNRAISWQVGEQLIVHNEDARNNAGTIQSNIGGNNWWNCNSSAPLDILVNKCNGFDMRFCGGSSGEDCDAGLRLTKAGLSIIYNPHAQMYHTDHDDWKTKTKKFCSHDTFKFRNSMSWDPATSGDDALMENDKIVCWYDKWGLKRWRCKECETEGLVDSVHLLDHNAKNNIIMTPCGLNELKDYI